METFPTKVVVLQNIDETVWIVMISSRTKKKIVMPAHLMPKSAIDLVFDSMNEQNIAEVGLNHDQLQACFKAWKKFMKSQQDSF